MEFYVQLIFVLVLFNYTLKASLTSKLWGMAIFGIVASALSIAFYPYIIHQPLNILQTMLTDKTLVANWAALTTVESVAGIFISIYLIDNYFLPRKKQKKRIFIAKIVPGVLFVLAIGYFELMFFKLNAGENFIKTTLIFAFGLGLLIFALAAFIHWLFRGDSLKLELKILINIAVLIIGLLVNSSVADYNSSNAQTTIEWQPLLAIVGLVAVCFLLGLISTKISFRKIIKKIK